jgi:hypothetical protein
MTGPGYFLSPGFLPSNWLLSKFGIGIAGPVGTCVLGETRCTVQSTISSELLF